MAKDSQPRRQALLSIFLLPRSRGKMSGAATQRAVDAEVDLPVTDRLPFNIFVLVITPES